MTKRVAFTYKGTEIISTVSMDDTITQMKVLALELLELDLLFSDNFVLYHKNELVDESIGHVHHFCSTMSQVPLIIRIELRAINPFRAFKKMDNDSPRPISKRLNRSGTTLQKVQKKHPELPPRSSFRAVPPIPKHQIRSSNVTLDVLSVNPSSTAPMREPPPIPVKPLENRYIESSRTVKKNFSSNLQPYDDTLIAIERYSEDIIPTLIEPEDETGKKKKGIISGIKRKISRARVTQRIREISDPIRTSSLVRTYDEIVDTLSLKSYKRAIVTPVSTDFGINYIFPHLDPLMECDELFFYRSKYKNMADTIQSRNVVHPTEFIVSQYIKNYSIPSWFPRIYQVSHIDSEENKIIYNCQVHETLSDIIFKILGNSIDPNLYYLQFCGTKEIVVDLQMEFAKLNRIHKSVPRRQEILFRIKLKDSTFENYDLIMEYERSNTHIIPLYNEDNNLETPTEQVQCYNFLDFDLPYWIKVRYIDDFPFTEILDLFFNKGDIEYEAFRSSLTDSLVEALHRVKIKLFVVLRFCIGSQELDVIETDKEESPLWMKWMTTNYEMRQFPQETKIEIRVYASSKASSKQKLFAHGTTNLFDYAGYLYQGVKAVPLFSVRKKLVRGTSLRNIPADFTLNIEFSSFSNPVRIFEDYPTSDLVKAISIHPTHRETIDSLCNKSPGTDLEKLEIELIWIHREWIKENRPNSIGLVIKATNFTNPQSVGSLHDLLRQWIPVDHLTALNLLDIEFMDDHVRSFAVKCLRSLNDYELSNYLLQIVEVLKYESFYDNSLSRFLLERAFRNKNLIGTKLFWLLKSEMHKKERRDLHASLIEAYCSICPDHKSDLITQVDVIKRLKKVATDISTSKDNVRKSYDLVGQLEAINIPYGFFLPMNPGFQCKGLITEKCKFMDSNTVPLWLVFESVDPHSSPYLVMFKGGDDLRQDMLTLQVLGKMDEIWKREAIDCQFSIYDCLPTGREQGLIEIVVNSATNASIQKSQGLLTSAFSKTPLFKWLNEKNESENDFLSACTNFAFSLAGYCVASYIIGLGDRHNDNIMITTTGQFFHIDFAYFLGNAMKFVNYNRDKAPFIMTPEYKYVLGGNDSPNYQLFLMLSQYIFQRTRENYMELFILFKLMISAGIPQLQDLSDMNHMMESLYLELEEPEAAEKIMMLIDESLETRRTQLNFLLHNLAHPG